MGIFGNTFGNSLGSQSLLSTLSASAFGIDDIFSPIAIVNTEIDGFIEGTAITISAIDTIAHTITLSWLPNISSICTPATGKEWVVGIGVTTTGYSEPSVYGQDQAYLKILSGNDNTRVLNYDAAVVRYLPKFIVGARVYLYNIYNNGWEYNMGRANSLILKASSTYYSTMLGPGGVYKHSDGTYRMVVNGYSGTTWKVGLFSSPDLINWTSLSSVAKINPLAGTWRVTGIHLCSIIKHPTENKYFALANGQENGPFMMRVGWVKFDENMENIEYSPTELIPTTGLYSGLGDPSIIYYKGKYRMLVSARVDSAITLWEIREYHADLPEGPYTQVFPLIDTTSSAIRDTHTCFRSNHTQETCPFILNGELYSIVDGTSRWNNSASRGERIFGLVKYNDSSHIWENLRGGIYWGSYQFASAIWNRPEGHMGGYPTLYSENNTFYLFAAITSSTNAYQIVGSSKIITP